MTGQSQSLPNGWFKTNLSQIIVLSKEKVNPLDLDEIPYVSLEHIESGTCRITGHGWAKDVKSTKSVFQAGQILYGRLRPYLNKVFKPDFSGICSTDILVLTGTEALDNDFLLRFLSQNSVVQYATSRSSGINLPRVSFTALTEMPINLPPLNEQRRISNQINLLKEKSSRSLNALEKIPPLLEKFRQSVLSFAFRGDLTADWRAQNPDVEPAEKLLERIRKERRKRWEDEQLAKMKAIGKTPKNDKWKDKYKEPEPVDTTDLPELPEGWCWATIDEIASVGTGATPKRSNATYWNNGTIPWVASGALNEEFVNVPTEYVTENALKETNLTVYPSGTLLLAMYGEGKTRGKCAQLMMSATTNQAIAAITIEEGGQPLANLLKYFLVLNYEKTRMAATGGVQPNLNLNIVRKISFPLLPIKEQKVFNDKIESFLSKTESVSTISSQLLKQLSILDQSILSKAFRGELVPQDPNDEPVSQLLERIEQEKAALKAETKQKGKAGRKKVTRKKKATAMAKKKERRSLVEVLRPHASGLSPEELFSQAGFDEHSVDEFYVELKNEVVNGNIIEGRPDLERVILRLNAA